MPTYIFECYKENNGCGTIFEIEAPMNDAPTLSPSCPQCNRKQSVFRNYNLQNINVFDASPKTVGALADRNTNRMSTDEKAHLTKKHTDYKQQPFQGTLPEGASLVPRDSSGKRIPSKVQRQSDPRRKQ